jgi:hypothetical protein
MTALIGLLVWSFGSALVGGLVAFGLNKWIQGWSLAKRISFAVTASTFPTIGIVGFLLIANPTLSVWWSPDEFVFPFALQIGLILLFSTPVAWLVSRRGARKPVLTDVFD